MASDLYPILMAARRPGGDEGRRFDDHVVASILAIGEIERATEGCSLAEATGLDGRDLGQLVAARFPRAIERIAVTSETVEVEVEEELLRDLLAAHAVEVGEDVSDETLIPVSDIAGTVEGAHSSNATEVPHPLPSSPAARQRREGDPGELSIDRDADWIPFPSAPSGLRPGTTGESSANVLLRDGDVNRRELRAASPPLHHLLARMIARRAMRADHLWQDLGLADRSELNRLLARHFPALHAGNTGNMRWKKYFYRRLCEAEGFVLCAAPSCAVCSDFHACFGAEDGESRLARVRRAHEVAGRAPAVAIGLAAAE